MAQPGGGLFDRSLSKQSALGDRASLDHAGRWTCRPRRIGIPGVQRGHWFGVPAAPGRRRHLGSRHSGRQHQPHRGHPVRRSVPPGFRRLSRGHQGGVRSGTARRRHRHRGIRQYRVFRGSQPKGAVAARVPSGQRRTDRRHEPRTRKISRRPLEFLPAHRR